MLFGEDKNIFIANMILEDCHRCCQKNQSLTFVRKLRTGLNHFFLGKVMKLYELQSITIY